MADPAIIASVDDCRETAFGERRNPAEKPGSDMHVSVPLVSKNAMEAMWRLTRAGDEPEVLPEGHEGFQDRLRVYTALLYAAGAFIHRGGVFPCYGEMNSKPQKEVFEMTISSISEEHLAKYIRCCRGADSPPESRATRLTDCALLVVAAGEFVTNDGVVNSKGFNAALANLNEAVVGKVATFFDTRSDAAFVLLRASARFLDQQGQFKRSHFNQVLQEITSANVKRVMEQMKVPKACSAVDILLRPL
jgi:hypothetical protein